MSVIAPITLTQVFSRNALGFLWSKRTELDPAQVKIIQSLYNNKAKGVVEGSHSVTYKLSNKKAGKLGYGRLYGDIGSLETLEREARGTLCREFYDDVDVVNCHPIILVQLAKREYNTPLPELEKYIQNRSAYLEQISENKDEAKKAIISVLYNGACKQDFLLPLAKEVKSFNKMLRKLEKFQPLWETLRNELNQYGSFLSFILQTEERHIMLSMRAHFEANGRSVDVLAYDGVMIRKNDKPLTEPELRLCEAHILRNTNYAVNLLIKPFEFYKQEAISEEIAPKVLLSAFLDKKALFEQNHFYLSTQNKIVEVSPAGDINAMSIEHASIYLKSWDFCHSSFSTDRSAFVPLWLNCADLRKVNTISMKPSDDPLVYTLPIQFAYTKVQAPSDANVLRLFNILVDLWANGDVEKRAYLIRYFAHMIQKPFEIPGVALVVSGKMGTGKDTLANLLSEYVIGQQYSVNYTQTHQLFGSHDSGTMNKILVKVEEADGKVMRANMSAMKAFITSPLSLFNPKGIKEIQCESFNRFILTTNEANPVKIDQNDRRFLLLNCSAKYLGNREFWTEVYSVLFNVSAGAVIGEYLANYDLNGFNVRLLPVDEYKNELAEDDKTSIEKFVDSWSGVETKITALFGDYRLFCIDSKLNDFGDVRTFSKALQVFKRDSIVQSRVSHGFTLYSKLIQTTSESLFVDDTIQM